MTTFAETDGKDRSFSDWCTDSDIDTSLSDWCTSNDISTNGYNTLNEK